jgi:hypothetical protein
MFYVFVFTVANCSLLQANTVNNSYNIYKNKIYSNFSYRDINPDIHIMFYGVGLETKLNNNVEMLCSYATGNLKLKKTNKQKSTDKSHCITLNLKQYYNNFVLQYDFSYTHIAGTFKILQNSITCDTNTTVFAINLGKKFTINDNLYLLPKCGIVFDKIYTKKKIKTKTDLKKESDTSHGFILIPELIIGSDLFLPTAIKINPEISFSYLFDTNNSSNNKLNIKPKISIDVNRLYVAVEATSITESYGRSFLIKLGVLF